MAAVGRAHDRERSEIEPVGHLDVELADLDRGSGEPLHVLQLALPCLTDVVRRMAAEPRLGQGRRLRGPRGRGHGRSVQEEDRLAVQGSPAQDVDATEPGLQVRLFDRHRPLGDIVVVLAEDSGTRIC